MDYKFFLKRLALIIFRPAKAWDEISAGDEPVKVTRNYFVLPFAILAAIAAFLGSLLFTDTQLSVNYSVLVGIKYFLLPFAAVYGSAVIIKEITYPLDLGRSFKTAFRLVSYSMIPFFFCLILSSLLESLIFVDILGLYGLYIFWVGAERMLTPQEHKKMPLVIAAVIVVLTLWVGSGWFLSQVIERIYF